MAELGMETVWSKHRLSIINNVKVHLLECHVMDIIGFYSTRINIVVRKYSKYLPYYVVASEIDDLSTVSQLEFLETIKVWDPSSHPKIWPLAQARMVGAMKDHIRFISRSDPTNVMDWVTHAAAMYQAVNETNDFEKDIETGDQLRQAMALLDEREQGVVLAHTKKDMTFKEIGEGIGVSESQVSRIYKKAIEKLRKKLA